MTEEVIVKSPAQEREQWLKKHKPVRSTYKTLTAAKPLSEKTKDEREDLESLIARKGVSDVMIALLDYSQNLLSHTQLKPHETKPVMFLHSEAMKMARNGAPALLENLDEFLAGRMSELGEGNLLARLQEQFRLTIEKEKKEDEKKQQIGEKTNTA